LFQLKRSYKYFSILSNLANSFALPFKFKEALLSFLIRAGFVSLLFYGELSPTAFKISSFSCSSNFFYVPFFFKESYDILEELFYFI